MVNFTLVTMFTDVNTHTSNLYGYIMMFVIYVVWRTNISRTPHKDTIVLFLTYITSMALNVIGIVDSLLTMIILVFTILFFLVESA